MATTEISKTSIVENVWRNFYDRIKDQVTSVTITGDKVVTVQSYRGSFSDEAFENRSDLPFIVIDSPRFSTDYFTMGRSQLSGNIDLEIYTTQSESAEMFLSDMVQRGEIKIHMRRITFRFVYRYDKTNAF